MNTSADYSSTGGRHISKSSGARGRIAQVLAQARASLNEPSRPHTPLQLDQRSTFMSNSVQLDAINYYPMRKAKKRTSRKVVENKSDISNEDALKSYFDAESDFSRSRNNSIEKSDLVNLSSGNDESFVSYPVANAIDVDYEEDNVSSSTDFSITPFEKFKEFFDELSIQLARNRLLDDEAETLLLAMQKKCDDLNKRIRLIISSGAPKPTKYLFQIQTILQDINKEVENQPWREETKQIFHCLALRMTMNCAMAEEFSLYDTSLTVSNLEIFTQALYTARATPAIAKVSSSMLPDIDLSIEVTQSSDNFSVTAVSEASLKALSVSVECLQFVWSRLNIIFDIFSKSMVDMSKKQNLSISHNSSILSLLQSAAYLCASLRQLSNQDTDRKRLLHAGGLDVIVQSIDFYFKYATIVNSTKIKYQGVSSAVSEEEMDLATSEDRLVAPLIQCIGAIRNFSLDKTGRSILTERNIAIKLCSFLSDYNAHAEVKVNVSRVLAKLSLYDGFRSQICSSSAGSSASSNTSGHSSNSDNRVTHNYLEYIVTVINTEADKCIKIMNGNNASNADEQEEEASWPDWYTWPLISRIAFTLGNFTTTNENNRKTIGDRLRCSPSALLLLQVCTTTLTRVHSQRKAALEKKALKSGGIFQFAKSSPYVSLDEPVEEEEDGAAAEFDIDPSAELELRDAVIKLVRLIANLSINQTVGLAVGSNYDNLQIMLDLLQLCDQTIEDEEMLLNVIAALTNLTFYSCQHLDTKAKESAKASPPLAEAKQMQRLEKVLNSLSTLVADSLFHENAEIVLEAARVLGNLTRRPLVIQMLGRKRVDDALLLLLEHVRVDVVSAVAGVFVNFSAHQDGRHLLLTKPSISIVRYFSSLLRKSSLRDIPVSTLFTQILYNLISSAEAFESNREVISETNLQGTLEELIEIASEEVDMQRNDIANELVAYRRFVSVASSLFKHILDNLHENNGKERLFESSRK